MAFLTSAKDFINAAIDEATKRFFPQQLALAKVMFERKKKEVVNLIKTHPISQELDNHTTPSRILGTRGSLFGFVGFKEGFDPVKKIIEITEQKMTYKVRKRLLGGGFYVDLIMPGLRDYRVSELLLPWQGGYSFVDAIERGISGLNHYIQVNRNNQSSRSKEGLQQVRWEIRQKHFRGKLYLSEIFERVRKEGLSEVFKLEGKDF